MGAPNSEGAEITSWIQTVEPKNTWKIDFIIDFGQARECLKSFVKISKVKKK